MWIFFIIIVLTFTIAALFSLIGNTNKDTVKVSENDYIKTVYRSERQYWCKKCDGTIITTVCDYCPSCGRLIDWM